MSAGSITFPMSAQNRASFIFLRSEQFFFVKRENHDKVKETFVFFEVEGKKKWN